MSLSGIAAKIHWLKQKADNDPYIYFRPTPPQKQWIESKAKVKALIGGNQVGVRPPIYFDWGTNLNNRQNGCSMFSTHCTLSKPTPNNQNRPCTYRSMVNNAFPRTEQNHTTKAV